jgi:predicted glycoside hydrolase/deacetylase ChbG (UPF0249 family)
LRHKIKRITNRALGYPDEARLLLVNADDLGLYPSITDGIARAFSAGIVRSTSLMMPCPGATQAVQTLSQHPGLHVGVHLSIIRDLTAQTWGPLAPRERVPSLLDADGNLFLLDRLPTLLARATIGDVETEFRTQIDGALAANLTPTHLDWHCLYDGGRPDIFALTLSLAREYGLALRVMSPDNIDRLRRQGLPANDHPVLDSFSLALGSKQASYAGLLQTLPPGLTEWAVHPSLGEAASRAIDPNGWRVRRSDFDCLSSQEARDIIAAEGIILISYEALQQAWLHQSPSL